MPNKSEKKIPEKNSREEKSISKLEKKGKEMPKGEEKKTPQINKLRDKKIASNYKKPQLKFERIAIENKGKKLKMRNKLQGIVVSDKMDKTLVVSVSTIKIHSKYHKRYYRNKKYKVHDPNNKYKLGDEVTFSPCRPFSKEKKWIVTKS
jgi:small subunit ribosomal protein S17